MLTWKMFCVAMDVKYGDDWRIETLDIDEQALYELLFQRDLKEILYRCM